MLTNGTLFCHGSLPHNLIHTRNMPAQVPAAAAATHSELSHELVGGLAHNHGAEQLATQPRAATWRHVLLNDGHAHIRGDLGHLVRARQASGAGTDDDNV
jgi:hypothetical protein